MSAAMLKLLMTNSFERVVSWNYELRWGRRGLKNKIRIGVLNYLPPRKPLISNCKTVPRRHPLSASRAAAF